MLKTNSKTVRERIRAYILENALDENYESFDNLKDACIYIVNDVKRVCGSYAWNRKYNLDGWCQRDFSDWCRGLPGVFDCSFLYRDSAVELLGDILEETEAERSRYTESEAENRLLYLCFSEIDKVYRKNI